MNTSRDGIISEKFSNILSVFKNDNKIEDKGERKSRGGGCNTAELPNCD